MATIGYAKRAVQQQFTGKERDTESGLDNSGARFHASTMGRFMTPDTPSYIGQTLKDSGVVAQTFVLKPVDPILDALTATGAKYTSDGRILVLVLK